MNTNEKLQQAGLTGNEAKVYLELAKKRQLSANQLAKNLSLDRTLTYTILNHLIEKGQVNYIVKENKKFFSVAPPENLLNPIKSKETIIQDLIQELQKIESSEQQETTINVYEGDQGVRILLRLIQDEKEFIEMNKRNKSKMKKGNRNSSDKDDEEDDEKEEESELEDINEDKTGEVEIVEEDNEKTNEKTKDEDADYKNENKEEIKEEIDTKEAEEQAAKEKLYEKLRQQALKSKKLLDKW